MTDDDRITRVEITPHDDDQENSDGIFAQSNPSGKNPRTAATLSALCTGLGQWYNGEYAKGACLLFLQVINVALMMVIIGFFTFFAVWVVGVVDAYEVADNA